MESINQSIGGNKRSARRPGVRRIVPLTAFDLWLLALITA
jgi:hypothetical protein